MRDLQNERLIDERQIERLLQDILDRNELPSHKPFLPMDEWLRLKAAGEQHKLNHLKRKLNELKR